MAQAHSMIPHNMFLALLADRVNYEEVINELPEEERTQFKSIWEIWIKLQEEEIREMGRILVVVLGSLDPNDKKVKKRIESSDYLRLVKKSFRNWPAADSDLKRRLLTNLLISSAQLKLVPDDVLHMFIDWIDNYSDAHFHVIDQIYKNPGLTRREIWLNLYGEIPPENSAEADMYKLLIQDLSTGYIIRQAKEKDFYGNTVRAKPTKSPYKASTTTKAFDDKKKYQLTELGKQFARYMLHEDEELSESLLS